ncbi:MAG: SGNH/GDSL hydrolase family protein [Nannocystaceae bacterium]
MSRRRPAAPLLVVAIATSTACFADDAELAGTESAGGTATSGATGADPTSASDATTTSTGVTGDPTTSSSTSGEATTTDGETETETGEPPLFAPELYPTDRTHSPITPYVAASIAAIAEAAPRRDDVFSKIGASSTETLNFMGCFADNATIELAGRDHLWAAIETFRAEVDGTTSFDRQSLCATKGWSAVTAISGDPSPLQLEIDTAEPRFAVVMYGTNDIQLGSAFNFGGAMLTLVETMTTQGVVPLLTTIQPRDDDPEADAEVPLYNAIIRAIAQAEQIPLIDFHRELMFLSDHGLGGDGIHRSVYAPGGIPSTCVLDTSGLEYGANIRNLLSLEALDRARVVVGGVDELDAPQLQLLGAGLPDDPYGVAALPFGDRRDTAVDGVALIDSYPGCDADQDESGNEVYYRLDVAESETVRAIVIDRGDVDIDLHLVDASATGAGCIARADKSLTAELGPGTYYFILDTFVSGGNEAAGDYLFVIERAGL